MADSWDMDNDDDISNINNNNNENKKKRRKKKKKKKVSDNAKCFHCKETFKKTELNKRNDESNQYYCELCITNIKCDGCNKWTQNSKGKKDNSDGNWYCKQCWAAYERVCIILSIIYIHVYILFV